MLVRLALAGAIAGFAPGLFDSFAAPKAALLRVAGLPLLALALVRALAALRARGAGALAAAGAAEWADRAAAAWAVLACVSAAAGVAPAVSGLGELGQREGALTSLALVGLWFGARASHRSSAHGRKTAAVAFGAAALAAVYALAQFAGRDPLAWEDAHRYAGLVRPGATLGNPILLGTLLAAVFAGAAAALAAGIASAASALPLLAVTGAALATTLSRGAWLAAACGLAAALLVPLVAGPRARRRGALLALAGAVVPAGSFAAFALRDAALARVTESAAAGASSSPFRAALARGALALWGAHPWLGTGPDTFGLAFTRVQPPAMWRAGWFGLPMHAHSAPLQLLVTTGALGALAALAWLASAALASRRDDPNAPRTPRPALAAVVALLVGASVNPLGHAGAALLVVMGALLVRRPGATDVAPTPRGAAALAVLVALAAGAFAGPELTALRPAAQARADLLADAPPAAALAQARAAGAHAENALAHWRADDELARLACDARVLHVDAALEAGAGAEAAAAADAALAHARAALARVPGRAANVQRLADASLARARVAHAAGETDAEGWAARADSAFREARALAPADGLLLVDEARANLVSGRASAARTAAERIVALYPEAATGHALVAAGWLAGGNAAAARTALERALAAHWEDGSEPQRAAARAMLERLRALPAGPAR